LRIPRALYDEIVAHALQDAPNECCGMIAALDGEAVAVHRTANTENSPFRYKMEPMEQYRVQVAIEDAGHELGAIYHSHTRSEPVPSQTDVNLAFFPKTDHLAFPGTLYVIVGVAGDEPEMRAWRIHEDRRFTEAALEVV
jgi:proteasome lid subunit RPN8/RPN11